VLGLIAFVLALMQAPQVLSDLHARLSGKNTKGVSYLPEAGMIPWLLESGVLKKI
jgi:hypothetical protein